MALGIRGMRLVSTGTGSAMTEILIADHSDVELAVEGLRIRVRISLREIDVRNARNLAMQCAGRICDDIERCLSDAHSSNSPE